MSINGVLTNLCKSSKTHLITCMVSFECNPVITLLHYIKSTA